MLTEKVPFLDLDSHHQPRREEFSCAISEVIDSGALPEGPLVSKFEREFASFCGCQHAAGVAPSCL